MSNTQSPTDSQTTNQAQNLLGLDYNKNNKQNKAEKIKANFWQKLQEINPFGPDKGIRTQLLAATLPTLLIPLAVVSIVAYKTVHKESEERIETMMKNQVILVGTVTGDILANSLENGSKFLKTYLEHTGLRGTQQIQLVEAKTGKILESIRPRATKAESKVGEVMGEEVILKMAQILVKTPPEGENLQKATAELQQKYSLKEFNLVSFSHQVTQKQLPIISFLYGNKKYYLTKVADTELVAVGSMDYEEIEASGGRLINRLAIIAIILAIAIVAIIFYWSNQLSRPLVNLIEALKEAANGNLDVVAIPQGSKETRILANNFNNLIQSNTQLLQEDFKSLEEVQIAKEELEKLAEEQKIKNELIQEELFKLLTDVEGASSGDLTVRAEITGGEIGIVADFFNSIVENLRDLVTQVKQTTTSVNQALVNDEEAMEQITKEAIKQSQKTRRMLDFVEEMTQSIQQVAENTQSVAKVAQKASATAETGGVTIDRTVKSIVQLRETVGETAKKVKRLGESSQQISKVISLINQIALQTNLLAINASIEAARAGEEGRGFAVVAEEVGQLAAQSAEATKEIEQIVESIQKETSEVVGAMEEGTTQVVQGSRLVSQAKKNFSEIVSVSHQIDQLLQSISAATVSQTKTSKMVANLMKEIVKTSQESSQSSQQVSHSLQQTVETARQLQTSVETFKVEEKQSD